MTINESSRTITLNKKEMTAARHFGSDDYKALQEARRDYPGFAVIAATRKATTQRETYKGLTYAYPITIGFLRGDKMIDYAKEVNDYGRSLAPVAK